MPVASRLRTWLPAAALLAFCLPAPAAPAPAPKAVNEQYLPDDADFVLVVNVREIAASPLYTRHFQKQLQELLKTDGVPQGLRDLLTALPRDVERLTVAIGRSGYGQPEDTAHSGPTIVVEGRPTALWGALKRLAGDVPGIVKATTVGEADVYQIAGGPGGPSGFAVLPDAKTLVLAPRKEQIAEVLEKAAGEKRTKLRSQALRELLGGLSPEQTIGFVGTKEMVTDVMVTSTVRMGQRVTEAKYNTLADSGIDSLRGSVQVGEDIKGRVTLTAKDEDTAKRLSRDMNKGLDMIRAECKREAARQKELLPVLKALESVKIGANGPAIALEAQGGAEILESVLTLFAPRKPEKNPPLPAPARP
jgi:hypothetical protein